MPVELQLRFTAWSEPLSFKSGLTAVVAAEHYEQPGSMAGTIVVDGHRHGLAGAGLRDHSWGVRDWQAVPYWRWFGMVVDPDTFLVVNNVGTADGGETAGGYLMRDGVLAPIVECRTQSELDPQLGCQRSFEAHAADSNGRRTVLSGPGARGRSPAPAPQRPPHAGERRADRVPLERPAGSRESPSPDSNCRKRTGRPEGGRFNSSQ